MNNEKDTKKTATEKTQAANNTNHFNNINSLNIKPISEFANKKTEKLVTALCMVADCMDTEDVIRHKLRLLGVELLSDISQLSLSLPMHDDKHIRTSIHRIKEILSLLYIAETITYISTMNSSILRVEFNNLLNELQSYQSQEKHFPFSLDEEMFTIKSIDANNTNIKDTVFNIKDRLKRSQSMSFIKDVPKKSLTASDYKKVKKDRAERIIKAIKDKMNTKDGGEGATIRDISTAVTNCSEKTIQREILDLISKGEIKKIGAKRWSRYQINKK